MECPGQSFRLAPSRRLLYALCALHLAALAGLAATALPPAVMLALALLLLASLARQWRAHAVLARGGGTRLEFRGESWWLHGDGAPQPVRLRADSAVLPFLIVLRVQQARRVRSLLVLGDSLPRGELRRLRVLLRLRGAG
jgi:hypothetical protein